MSGVRVLVGTRKGAFILTSDGTRTDWEVAGPHFGGWEMYHLKGSPALADRIYASQSTGWSRTPCRRLQTRLRHLGEQDSAQSCTTFPVLQPGQTIHFTRLAHLVDWSRTIET